MNRRSMLMSSALLAAGLSLGLLWSAPKETRPAGTMLEVTYYYLPG